jgi:hypothetical protein
MTINKYVEAEQRTSPAARYNGLFPSVSHWIFQWKVDKSEDIARLSRLWCNAAQALKIDAAAQLSRNDSLSMDRGR